MKVTPLNQHENLQSIWLESPVLAPLIDGWKRLELPDCWLVAGCLAQTVWNRAFSLPPTYGISDVDIVYFDPQDLSEDTEARHAARVRDTFSHLPVWIDRAAGDGTTGTAERRAPAGAEAHAQTV